MLRRSPPRKLQIDTAFPVRVKIRVPPNGLGMAFEECFKWLNESVGSDRFTQAATASLGGSATAFYFLCLEDALRFLVIDRALCMR